jgi:tetratricopeptide (TPR) repeat protein
MDDVRAFWQDAARRLLRRARHPAVLEREPDGIALRDATGTESVRDALLTCIERALAREDPRFAIIVRRCDLEGLPQKIVESELHVSPRQFARYRAAAMDAVGAEMLRVAEAASGAPRDPRAAEARRALDAAQYLVTRLHSPGDNVRAIGLVRSALRLDASLSDAWLVAATAHLQIAVSAGHDAGLAFARSLAALDRAAGLAPRSGAVRGLRAALRWWSARDPRSARALAFAALETDSGTARGHYTLGWIAALEREFDDAERHFAAAARFEPYFGVNRCSAIIVANLRGDFERCARMCAEVRAKGSETAHVTATHAEVLNALGRYAESCTIVKDTPADVLGAGQRTALARARALLGDRDGARAIAATLNGSLVEYAAIALALGDEDAAWDALERAPAERNAMLEIAALDSAFASIADEPRFKKILAESRRLRPAS